MRGAEVMIFNIFSNIDLLTCTVTEKNNENLIKTCMHIYIYIYSQLKMKKKAKTTTKFVMVPPRKRRFCANVFLVCLLIFL